MIRLAAIFLFISNLSFAAYAQERVVIGTQRLSENGALFLAAAQGYFKAEGIDLAMTAYDSDKAVAEMLAAQAREKRGYEGNQIIASSIGVQKGLRKFDNLADKTVAIDVLGSTAHYQLMQIARIRHVDPSRITVKALGTVDAIARAVGTEQVDAAIMPSLYARELLMANQAKFLGWYSELDEQQLGALFVSKKMLETRRAVVEKFVNAYRHGAADYAAALLRKDRGQKRISDIKSKEAATTIAHYVYPGRGTDAAATVELGAYYIDPQARLDVADVARQIAWYKAQGLIDKAVDARTVVDESFVK